MECLPLAIWWKANKKFVCFWHNSLYKYLLIISLTKWTYRRVHIWAYKSWCLLITQQRQRTSYTQKVKTANSVIKCNWAYKNQPCECKNNCRFFPSLFYHNLRTIHINNTKCLPLLQNFMDLQKQDTTFRTEDINKNITRHNLHWHSWFLQAQSQIYTYVHIKNKGWQNFWFVADKLGIAKLCWLYWQRLNHDHD